MEGLLQQANIPEAWWPYCTIKDGVIYTPNTEVLYKNGLATEEQYRFWLIQQEQIDICPEPTAEERIVKLEEEKAILAENVYELASILEFMLGGTEDGQSSTTTETTAD
ncbi:MAG: hypothetical protein E7231_00465 [Cellulosilyticum sp.]|nr:hypothetical protein [Cellulosilyticum sp.]